MDKQRRILIAQESGISIRQAADITDTLGVCLGSDGLLLAEGDLGPEFFDLRSGLAGELIQKFVNYRLRVAIIVPEPERYGQRFNELAYEHATHNLVRFVRTRDDAMAWLRGDDAGQCLL